MTLYYEEPGHSILCGNALDVLATLPAESVQVCVTSPPFFNLRDYQTGRWEGGEVDCSHVKPRSVPGNTLGKNAGSHEAALRYQSLVGIPYRETCRDCGARRRDQQIGLEETPGLYVNKIVAVFREIKRVLKNDGICWLNLGDSYANDGKWGGSSGGKHVAALRGNTGIGRNKTQTGLRPKNLIGIPWRCAFALQDDGWILRQEIIFSKVNPMPESVRDRCVKAHESLFLLVKNERYYWDYDAMREPAGGWNGSRFDDPRDLEIRPTTGRGPRQQTHGKHAAADPQSAGHRLVDSVKTARANGGDHDSPFGQFRTRRSVWTIASEPFTGTAYDFSGADYVDSRGIPRKWSPDCPMHEQDGQLRQENRGAVFYGEQVKPDRHTDNEHTVPDRDRAQVPAVDSKGDYKTTLVGDTLSYAQQNDTSANRTHGELYTEGQKTLRRTSDTQEEQVLSSSDSVSPSCEFSATAHNIDDCKNVLAFPIAHGDTSSAKLDDRSKNTAPQLLKNEQTQNTRESNTSRFETSHPRASRDQILFGKKGNSSYIKAKCECKISQLSHFAVMPRALVTPCILAGSRPGDVVLDPFLGSGTVSEVAKKHGRQSIGIDLNPNYCQLAADRLRNTTPSLFAAPAPTPEQLPLLEGR